MSDTQYPILESCITTHSQAVSAMQHGATRLEVCINIEEDGLTPPATLINQILADVTIPIRVLVRPRSGDFTYTPSELRQYYEEIEVIASLPVEGIVLGALDQYSMPDLDFLKAARSMTGNKKVVFHKAIDVASDIIQSTKILAQSGFVDGILSSGGESTARQGISTLLAMKEICGSAIELVAAGKITHQNRNEIHKELQLASYHGRKIVPILG